MEVTHWMLSRTYRRSKKAIQAVVSGSSLPVSQNATIWAGSTSAS
jgi:hypothetical protein